MPSSFPEIIEHAVPGLREDRGGLRAAREFTVYAASELEARAKLRTRKGIRLGVAYRTATGEMPDPFVVCVGLSVDPQGNGAPLGGRGVYTCRAEYAVEDNDGSQKRPEVGGPPVYTIEASMQSVEVDIDLDNNPITNSADEPYENVTALMPHEVLRVDWFVQGNRNAIQRDLRAYQGKVNEKEWQGAPKGSFLAHPFAVAEKGEGGLYLVTGRFEYAPPKELFGQTHEGWKVVKQDRGRRQVVEVGSEGWKRYEAITGKDGEALTEPVALDGSGIRAQAGADPVARTFRNYDYADFSALGI